MSGILSSNLAPGFILRPYQLESIEAAGSFYRTNQHPAAPVIELPTGSGKTAVIAECCRRVIEHNASKRILVVVPTGELAEQNEKAIRLHVPGATVGQFCATNNRRELDRSIVVATIGSIYKRAAELCESGPFALTAIDEAHRITVGSDGMYTRLIADLYKLYPTMRVLGLTATPFRTTSGLITGPDNFLTEIVYRARVSDLIEQGYLSPLRTKQSKHSAETSTLRIKRGEFDAKQMSDRFSDEEKVRLAVRETIELSVGRRAVVVFCCDVQHCHQVAAEFARHGKECGVVAGNTPKQEREQIVDRFRSGELMYLANCNCLTEGFDVPHIDCVVLLRATVSPGLYAQMVGRGLRKADGKTDCLVLDYGNNAARHGTVDNLIPPSGKTRNQEGKAPIRVCPSCDTVLPASVTQCVCGAQFPHKLNHSTTAATDDIVTRTLRDVTQVEYDSYRASSGWNCLRVSYLERGRFICSEFVPVENPSGRKLAERWWKYRTDAPLPATADLAAAIGVQGRLREPVKLRLEVEPGRKFPKIKRRVFQA